MCQSFFQVLGLETWAQTWYLPWRGTHAEDIPQGRVGEVFFPHRGKILDLRKEALATD